MVELYHNKMAIATKAQLRRSGIIEKYDIIDEADMDTVVMYMRLKNGYSIWNIERVVELLSVVMEYE
jgi:hypothetical protein